jgi:acyl carrier protein
MTGVDARTMVVESLRKVAGATAKPALRGVFQDPNSNVPIAQFGFDSLDAVEWCMEIETASGIELDPAELAPLVMLDDLVLLLAQRLGQSPEPDGVPPSCA